MSSAWIEAYDESGNLYYFNTETEESSWDPPAELSAPPPKGGALPPDWTECYDGEGNLYYFNSATGESSWEKPVAKPKSNNKSFTSSRQNDEPKPPTVEPRGGSGNIGTDIAKSVGKTFSNLLSKGKQLAKSVTSGNGDSQR